jgi:IS5 family transposase
MTMKTVNVKQAALAKARQRRLALDAERDERDRRVEDAAAEVFVLLGKRAEVERGVAETNAAIGRALRQVLEEGVGVDAAAQLVDLDAAEVRRLTKPTAKASATPTTEAATGARLANRPGPALEVAG